MTESTHYELEFETWPNTGEYRAFAYCGVTEEFDEPEDALNFWREFKKDNPAMACTRARIVEVTRSFSVERTIEP